MKKLLLMLLGVLIALPALARNFTFEYEGQKLTYTVLDEEAKTVKTYPGNYSFGKLHPGNAVSGVLKLPEYVTDENVTYKLVEIAEHSFSGCTGLVSISVPATVETIKDNAFRSCTGLTELLIEDGNDVLYLGRNTEDDYIIYDNVGLFRRSPLEKIYVGRELSYKDESREGFSPFYYISTLQSVKFGENVKTIGNYLFNNCKSLNSIELNSTIESIGSYAFTLCSFPKIDLPESLIEIGRGAFYKCSELVSIDLPEKIENIDSETFYECTSLSSINISSKVQMIGESAFDGCNSLLSVTIPDSVTSIGERAFYGCSSLSTISIPSSVNEIGAHAFFNCTNMKEVVIADGSDILMFSYGVFRNVDIESLYLGRGFTTESSSIERGTFSEKKNLSDLTIGNFVTLIGKNAFVDCTALTSVNIPASVTRIQEDAFRGCDNLAKAEFASIESMCTINYGNAYSNPLALVHKIMISGEEKTAIEIPETATNINAFAFYACDGLTSVIIPGSVESIGSEAFSGCSSLTEMIIADSYDPLSFGNGVFEGVNIETLYLGRDFTYPSSTDRSPLGTNLKSLTIGGSISKLDNEVFVGCCDLTSITIPASVTYIGDNAFKGCTGLKSVTLEAGSEVLTLGVGPSRQGLFYDCPLEELFIGRPLSYSVNNQNSPFAMQVNLKTVTLDANLPYITEEEFYGCSALKEISLPEALTSIGESAFSGCKNLKSIVIPPKVTTVDYSAFSDCTGLIKSAYPNKFKNNPFSNGVSVAYDPEDVIIEDNWIYGPEKTIIYFVPLSLEGEYTISQNVTSIVNNAFYGCDGLTTLNVSWENPTSIDFDAFSNVNYENTLLKIDNGNLLDYLAAGWGNFKNINIRGNSVKIYNDDVLSYRLIENPDNREAYVIKGNYFGLTDVSIPERFTDTSDPANPVRYYVTAIAPGAFKWCTSLTSVNINSRTIINTIGESAFENCYSLSSFNMPAELITIKDNAFENSGLREVTLNDKLTGIGNAAFKDCNLTAVTLPSSVKTIGESVFENNTAVTGLSLGSGLEAISNSAFKNCSSLTSVTIPGNIKAIGESAFMNCKNLLTINIPSNVKTIGKSSFMNNTSLTDLTFAQGVETIDNSAFENCESLKSVTLPGSVKTIGDNAFKNNSSLTAISFTKGLESIGNSAFENCGELGGVIIPDGVVELGDAVFRNCVKLEYAGIPGSVVKIGDEAFKNNSNLWAVEIGEGVDFIGNSAFENCTKLLTMEIPKGVKNIGNSAFANCSSLYSVSVPGSVKTIGASAFANNENLKSVVLREGLEKIEAYAFSNDPGITEIKLPETLREIGEGSFIGCNIETIIIPGNVIKIGVVDSLAENEDIDANNITTYFDSEQVTVFYDNSVTKWDWGYISYWNDTFVNVEACPRYKMTQISDYIYMYRIPYNPAGIVFREKNGDRTLEIVSVKNNNLYKGTTRTAQYNWTFNVVDLGFYQLGISNGIFSVENMIFADGVEPVEINYGSIDTHELKTLSWGRPIEDLNFDTFGLTSLTIGNVIEDIPNGKFSNHENLTALQLGTSLTSIGDNAFSGCTALEEVIVPPLVENIGASAFAGNSKLSSIIMGHSVKTIGEKAFDGCPAATVSITAQEPPTAPNNTFRNYTGKLWLQDPGDQSVMNAYYDAYTCWDRFDSYAMITPERIEGSTQKIEGKAGETFQIIAKIWPENVTLPQVFWRCTNPDIAVVDQNGLVTLVADIKDIISRAGTEDIQSCEIIAETLYSDGPVLKVTVFNESADIDEIISDNATDSNEIDFSAPYEVYNMQGMFMGRDTESLSHGFYIVRQGNVVKKIAVK